MAEFTFNIEEHLLTLSENDKGWTKELNRVSFNGAEAKWDIQFSKKTGSLFPTMVVYHLEKEGL